MALTITEIHATQTLIYTPQAYLEYCKDYGEEPSDEGLMAFIGPDIKKDFGGYLPVLHLHHAKE